MRWIRPTGRPAQRIAWTRTFVSTSVTGLAVSPDGSIYIAPGPMKLDANAGSAGDPFFRESDADGVEAWTALSSFGYADGVALAPDGGPLVAVIGVIGVMSTNEGVETAPLYSQGAFGSVAQAN